MLWKSGIFVPAGSCSRDQDRKARGRSREVEKAALEIEAELILSMGEVA
jgi:hypothetical protein